MVRVEHRALERFARDVVVGLGAPAAAAERVAESLVAADLRGHTSHGVLRLPLYAEMVEADRLDPTATPAVAGQRSHEWADNAALFVAFDPTRFTTEAGVRDRVTALADHLGAADYSPSVPAGAAAEGDDALLPGEAEYRTAAERREAGIPLPDRVADSLRELAVSRGLGDRVPNAFAE